MRITALLLYITLGVHIANQQSSKNALLCIKEPYNLYIYAYIYERHKCVIILGSHAER